MENISDRLNRYMDFKGLNANKLTVEAGLSVGLIGKSIKAKTGLHSDTIEKILHTYKDINPEWFLTGKGEMLRGNTDINKVKITEDTVLIDKELFLDMYQKVDYLFKLNIQDTVEKELLELRNEILKSKKSKSIKK